MQLKVRGEMKIQSINSFNINYAPKFKSNFRQTFHARENKSKEYKTNQETLKAYFFKWI